MQVMRRSFVGAIFSLGVFLASCGVTHTTRRNDAAVDARTVEVDADTSAPPAPVRTELPWNRRAAAEHLDARVVDWIDHTPRVGNNFACAMTCHTAMPFAFALGATGDASEVPRTLRKQVEARVRSVDTWRDATPFYGASNSQRAKESLATEAVLNAATLSAIDRREGRGVQPATFAAFDRMWQMQRDDGGFDWLDFDLEPFENASEIFGAAVATQAIANLPPEDRSREAARIERLQKFLAARGMSQTAPLFARALTAIAAARLPGTLDAASFADGWKEIASTQGRDGGWSWQALGVPTYATAAGATSDALPTAIALLALESIPPAERPPSADYGDAIDRASAWLAVHQAPDGSFPSKSPNRDAPRSNLVMTDAATAYAAMALAEAVP
jgi:squalene-hopene/tetraprenyl-beta-curcumene cyclase